MVYLSAPICTGVFISLRSRGRNVLLATLLKKKQKTLNLQVQPFHALRFILYQSCALVFLLSLIGRVTLVL